MNAGLSTAGASRTSTSGLSGRRVTKTSGRATCSGGTNAKEIVGVLPSSCRKARPKCRADHFFDDGCIRLRRITGRQIAICVWRQSRLNPLGNHVCGGYVGPPIHKSVHAERRQGRSPGADRTCYSRVRER
jgi:hypothetical protein